MTTTFINHRMFVAALNHDQTGSPGATLGRRPAAEAAPVRTRDHQLTVEQLAAFAARYWPDLSFMSGRGRRAW